MITFVLALASRASRGALPPFVLALNLASRASRGALPPLVLALIGRPVRALRTSYGNMEISCGCPKRLSYSSKCFRIRLSVCRIRLSVCRIRLSVFRIRLTVFVFV